MLIGADKSESSHLFHLGVGIRGWDGLRGIGYGMKRVKICDFLVAYPLWNMGHPDGAMIIEVSGIFVLHDFRNSIHFRRHVTDASLLGAVSRQFLAYKGNAIERSASCLHIIITTAYFYYYYTFYPQHHQLCLPSKLPSSSSSPLPTSPLPLLSHPTRTR